MNSVKCCRVDQNKPNVSDSAALKISSIIFRMNQYMNDETQFMNEVIIKDSSSLRVTVNKK